MVNSFIYSLATLCFFLVLTKGHPDSVLVERNHRQFEATIHTTPELALQHLDSLKGFRNSSYARANFLYAYDSGYAKFVQHRMEEAETAFKEAWQYARAGNMGLESVLAEIWIANMYFFINEWDAARSHYKNVIQQASKLNYVDGIANGYYGLASVTRDNVVVLKQHLKIDSIYSKHDTISPILSNSLGAIAKIYIQSGYLDRGLEYLNKSVEVAELTNYVPGVVYSNEMYGIVEKEKGNLDKAEYYFTIALAEAEKRKDFIYYAHNLTNLSKIDIARGDYLLAEDKVRSAMKLYTDVDDQVSISNCNLLLAEINIGKENYKEAKHYLNKAWEEAEFLDEVDYMKKYYGNVVMLNEATATYSQAYFAQKKLDSLNALQKDLENDIAFFELERKVSDARDKAVLDKLNSEKQLIEQRQVNQRNILLAGLGFVSLAAFSLFILYRNRNKTNQKLKEIDLLKSNFFANISHEFRTPLTLISSPLEKHLESKKLSAKDREDFELIQRSSGRLLSLVDQLLDLSRLEAGKYRLRVGQGDLGTFIKAIAESFKFPAREKDLSYEIKVEVLNNAWYDADAIEKIVTNLLSNAIKYTEKQGTVSLRLSQSNGTADLIVQNAPTDMDPGSIQKLFKRFYQKDPHAEGAGIGLSLVKELTERMRGTVTVDPIKPDGVEFRLQFPVSRKAFKQEEFTEAGTQRSPFERDKIPDIPIHSEARTFRDPDELSDRDILLIVEDNADLRKLVRDEFGGEFEVIEASNGHQGIEQALTHIPDLVISDIMMPIMDGFELLSSLKGDERTSHVPIILLTAKAGEEDQYKGLSTGADAYVTKPFKMKLLKTRVHKLIESRKKLRDRYSQEVVLKPKDIAITNLDEQFLERVQEVLELKLTESDFNVQEFSDAVGMSRMQLHRKLKALTGLSASEFVRSQRLKLAASLLIKSDANVSQIGYEVGFNDPSYFTKCFKEAYGVSPSEYSKKKS